MPQALCIYATIAPVYERDHKFGTVKSLTISFAGYETALALKDIERVPRGIVEMYFVGSALWTLICAISTYTLGAVFVTLVGEQRRDTAQRQAAATRLQSTRNGTYQYGGAGAASPYGGARQQGGVNARYANGVPAGLPQMQAIRMGHTHAQWGPD